MPQFMKCFFTGNMHHLIFWSSSNGKAYMSDSSLSYIEQDPKISHLSILEHFFYCFTWRILVFSSLFVPFFFHQYLLALLTEYKFFSIRYTIKLLRYCGLPFFDDFCMNSQNLRPNYVEEFKKYLRVVSILLNVQGLKIR